MFSEQNISIETVLQKGKSLSEVYVPLVIMTHEAIEKDMSKAIENIVKLEVVHSEYSMVRVESNHSSASED